MLHVPYVERRMPQSIRIIYLLPLVFAKRLCDVFDDEVNRVAEKVKSRSLALELIENDYKLVRFYLLFQAKNIEYLYTLDNNN